MLAATPQEFRNAGGALPVPSMTDHSGTSAKREEFMREEIEKTEARQGERKRWQEHVLIWSLAGGVAVLVIAVAIFAGIAG